MKIKENYGWICPICGRVYNPNVKECEYCYCKNNNLKPIERSNTNDCTDSCYNQTSEPNKPKFDNNKKLYEKTFARQIPTYDPSNTYLKRNHTIFYDANGKTQPLDEN